MPMCIAFPGTPPLSPDPFLQASGGPSTASLLWGCLSQLFSPQQCVQSVRGCSDLMSGQPAAGETPWRILVTKEREKRGVLHGFVTVPSQCTGCQQELKLG